MKAAAQAVKLVLALGISLLAMGSAGVASAVTTGTYQDILIQADLGYVGGDMPVLSYTHTLELDPGHELVSLDSVWLQLMVADDWGCEVIMDECYDDYYNQPEEVEIQLGGEDFFAGSASSVYLFGDVTYAAEVSTSGASLDVVITAIGASDFVVMRSVATFGYGYEPIDTISLDDVPDSPPSMPEPSAAIVFGVGLALLAPRMRSRR